LTPAEGGTEVAPQETPLEIPALGQMTDDVMLGARVTAGEYLLSARAYRPSKKWSPIMSRPKGSIVASKE
jgi:hypothetical protein